MIFIATALTVIVFWASSNVCRFKLEHRKSYEKFSHFKCNDLPRANH